MRERNSHKHIHRHTHPPTIIGSLLLHLRVEVYPTAATHAEAARPRISYILGFRLSSVVGLRHFVGVTLQAFIHVVHLRVPSAAKDNLRHVPAALEDVSDIQDFEESTTNTATSWHRPHQVKVRLSGEGPDKDYRYQEHLAASHESRCAYREIKY